MLNLADKRRVAKSFRGESYCRSYVEASLLCTGVFWYGMEFTALPGQVGLQAASLSADEHLPLPSIGWRGLEVHYLTKVVVEYSPQFFSSVIENTRCLKQKPAGGSVQ